MDSIMRRATVWMVLGTAAAALGQQASPRPAGERASLTLTLFATPRGRATHPTITLGPIDLEAGATLPKTAYGVIVPGASGCDAQMRVRQSAESLLDRFAVAWDAEVAVRSISTGQIEVEVSWRRLERGDHGTPVRVAGAERQTITLEEGDRVLLDFAGATRSGDGLCASSYSLELTAEMTEDPALAARQIGYEVWRTHAGPGGERESSYLGLTAMQGDEVSFEFQPVRLPVLAGLGARDVTSRLQVGVRGKLRGRIRHDGSLDLALETVQSLQYVSSGDSGGILGHVGEKRLSVRPEEVIRVELPDPNAVDRPEPYVRDLAGHELSLILRARALQ